MALRAWLQSFVASGALAWAILPAHSVVSQQPATPDAGSLPQLPETEVVAESAAPRLTPDFEPFAQPTILDSNPFAASPAVGYGSRSTTTGSWIAVPDLVHSSTVNTVTEQLRRDQQVIQTDDLIRDIGGAVKAIGNGGDGVRRPDAFSIRGFELSSNNYRKNGFLDPTYTPRDYQNVERVEVLKGPASVAYGSALPTGTFNVVTKRAVQDRFVDGGFQFGSWGLNRYTVDANNMNQAGDILFRFNVAHHGVGSFRDYGVNERTFFAPTTTMLLDDDTVLTYEAEYNNDRRQYDTGVVAISGNTEALPASRFLGNPANFIKAHDYRSTLTLTHSFNDDWSLYLGTSSIFYDFQNQGTQPVAAAPIPGNFDANGFFTNAFSPGATLIRRQYLGGQKGYNHAAIANLNRKFNGPLFRHNAVVGTEMNWNFQRAFFPSSIPGLDSALLIDPESAGPFTESIADPSFDFAFNGLYTIRTGVYFQDLVELTDRLYLNYGVRYDNIRQTADYNVGFPIHSAGSFDQGTPKVGLTYQLVPELLSIYGLYTTSFNPIGSNAFGFPGPGANTDPELGRIFEAGVKAQLRSNLVGTFSAFQIDRFNVAVQPEAGLTYVQAGQRSKGVEFNLMGNWTERLSTVSNYSYTDVAQNDNNPAPNIAGRVRGVPYNLANSWTRYNLIQNQDRIVGLGLGYVYVGDRRGDYNTPLVLPSYGRWDVGVFSSVGRWNLDAYVENIFDTRYSVGSVDQFNVMPGAPANFRFQLGATF